MKKTAKLKTSETTPSAATMPAPTTAQPPIGEFKILPRDLIRPDPNQPRKEFDQLKLEELAESIKQHGIAQPLVVQFVAKTVKIHEPDMIQKKWHATDPSGAVVFEGEEEAVKKFAEFSDTDHYQLIFGERRWRAAGIAGLKEVPVIVRDITDKDRFALQFAENHQRVNLTALEEAAALDKQIRERKAADPSFSAEVLAKELGLARGTVYNRLKLLRLHEPVRKALLAGKIEVSVAGAIASIPDLKQQEKLLEEIEEAEEYGEVLSYRRVCEMVEDEYAKQLTKGPFNREDATLVAARWQIRAGEKELVIECEKQPEFLHPATIGVPKVVASSSLNEHGKFYVTSHDNFDMAGPVPKSVAKSIAAFLVENAKAAFLTVTRYGGGACTDCPHRSGVMDPESKNGNVCTVPSCFDAKVKAHWLKKSEDLRAKGTEVLSEAEMRKRGKHVDADKYEYCENRHGAWKELMGKHAPEPVLVATKAGIKKFYPVEDALAAARKNGVKFYSHTAPKTKEQEEKEKAEERKREERKKQRAALADELLPVLAKALAAADDKAAWALLDSPNGNHHLDRDREKKLLATAKTPRARVLGRFFARYDARLLTYNGEWDEDTLELYKAVGIDVLAEEKKFGAGMPKPAELGLKKADPKQKELLNVGKSKAPKKRAGGG